MSQAAPAAAPAVAPAAGRTNKKLIIIVAAVVMLAAIGAGTVIALKGGGSGDAQHAAEAKQEEPPHESVYVDIKPEFVVNFRDKAGHPKYLKCDLSVSSKEPEIEKAVEKHLPAIRNSLVMLLSAQIYEDLLANEGKEKLRADALAGVRAVMQAQIGKPGIDDLFFSNFVMH